jgi:hypothetical protein
MNFARRMLEQDREYRPRSQSKRGTKVECTLPNIVTPVLALKVHEKLFRKRNLGTGLI